MNKFMRHVSILTQAFDLLQIERLIFAFSPEKTARGRIRPKGGFRIAHNYKILNKYSILP